MTFALREISVLDKKISIIIPIYNTTEFLEECIGAVIDQTYKNIEVLLINDGSNEECTEKIIELSERDKRIIVHHFTMNKGVGIARNFGLEQATGQYVYFLDSDDMIPKNTLEQLVMNIGDSDLISGEIKIITKDPKNGEKNRTVVKESRQTKQFENSSALHRLILKSFIVNHQIGFDEDVVCYSDLKFMAGIIRNIKEALFLSKCLYYKRLRNDPISNPSLIQSNEALVISDFLTVYNRLRKNASPNEDGYFLDQQFLELFKNTITPYVYQNEDIHSFFEQLNTAALYIDKIQLSKLPKMIRTEIKALEKGQKKRFVRLIKMQMGFMLFKQNYKSRQKLYLQMYRKLFMRMPLKEKTIVFESFLGKNYSDSPKYIYEYMVRNNMDYKYVWIFNEKGRQIPGNAKQVKRASFAYYYYLGTSKFWVSNSRMPKFLNKREGNIFIQTWHGTPLKKLVFDMKDIYSANPDYKKDFYEQSRRWDYLVSPNQYSSDIFRSAFKYDKEMLEFGYPRNDILYDQNRNQMAESIKRRLNIPLDKEIILYAPTWRDDEFYETGKYKFDLKLDLGKLYEELGDKYIILLRMHYFIADNIDTAGYENFAYNLSKYDDISELYLISDLLITDYSSVFFDYANLQRPILFFTYDLEKYRDTLRGFYIDIEKEVPGPLLKTSEEVIQAIKHIGDIQEQYKLRYQMFYEKFCNWDDGRASDQIVKHVFCKH